VKILDKYRTGYLENRESLNKGIGVRVIWTGKELESLSYQIGSGSVY
jgi:hypothetical protein